MTLKKIFISLFSIILFLCSLSAYTSRVAPSNVEPITYKGLKYNVVHWGISKGLDQQGGYIEIIDVKKNKHLYYIKVYSYTYNEELEKDVQDIFIKSMKRVDDTLIVIDEKNRKYQVDLKTRKVKKI